MAFDRNSVMGVFLEELKKILADEKEINEAVRTRHILEDKNADLTTIADRFDAEGKAIAPIAYHEKARADNERRLYLSEATSDRAAILWQSVYFTAAANTNQKFLPMLAKQMTEDKSIGDQLKAMVEDARFAVAMELREADLREVKRVVDILKGLEKDLPTLTSVYAGVVSHLLACMDQIKQIERNIIAQVNKAGVEVKTIQEASDWVAAQQADANVKAKISPQLNQAIADRDTLQRFVNILILGNRGKPSDRVKEFYDSFRQWRSEYKGSHGVKASIGTSIFSQPLNPVYKIWEMVKPTVKALEQKFKP